jgi:hypothetical protein
MSALIQILLQKSLEAVSLFSGPYYFAEQLGFRKIIDTTYHFQRFGDVRPESAYPPTATTERTSRHVSNVPLADSCTAANGTSIRSPPLRCEQVRRHRVAHLGARFQRLNGARKKTCTTWAISHFVGREPCTESVHSNIARTRTLDGVEQLERIIKIDFLS